MAILVYDFEVCMENHQFDKAPFEKKYLGDSKEDVFPVRLNAEERAALDDLKRILNCPKDVTILKQAFWLLHDDIHGRGKGRFFQWLSEVRRVRERD